MATLLKEGPRVNREFLLGLVFDTTPKLVSKLGRVLPGEAHLTVEQVNGSILSLMPVVFHEESRALLTSGDMDVTQWMSNIRIHILPRLDSCYGAG